MNVKNFQMSCQCKNKSSQEDIETKNILKEVYSYLDEKLLSKLKSNKESIKITKPVLNERDWWDKRKNS